MTEIFLNVVNRSITAGILAVVVMLLRLILKAIAVLHIQRAAFGAINGVKIRRNIFSV